MKNPSTINIYSNDCQELTKYTKMQRRSQPTPVYPFVSNFLCLFLNPTHKNEKYKCNMISIRNHSESKKYCLWVVPCSMSYALAGKYFDEIYFKFRNKVTTN